MTNTTPNPTADRRLIEVEVIAGNKKHDWSNVRFPSGAVAAVKTSVDLSEGAPSAEQIEREAAARALEEAATERERRHGLPNSTAAWLRARAAEYRKSVKK